jgi:hypothetical protein
MGPRNDGSRPEDGRRSTTDASLTPLQAHWLPLRQAVDDARRELDGAPLEVFLSMLAILVARLHAERLGQDWQQAA